MRRSLSIGVLPMRSRMLSTGLGKRRVKARRILATKTAARGPPLGWSMSLKLRPARGASGRTALVVAIAAVDRLAADRGERNFRRHAAAIAGHADHLALARSAAAAVARH